MSRHDCPPALWELLERLARETGRSPMMAAAGRVSRRYREEKGTSRTLRRPEEALAYALSRMPATYGAAHAALEEALELTPGVRSLLDCGCGTGAVVLAAGELTALPECRALERESAMREVAARIFSELNVPCVPEEGDVLTSPLPGADLVTCGYVLGELAPEDRLRAAERMFAACRRGLLLLEPGTPEGYLTLARVRQHLEAAGARVAAPCPGRCALPEGDWCHFAVRVQRSRTHRQLKEGSAPFEDEKFAWLYLTREDVNPGGARILRHPRVESGKITLRLCADGSVCDQEVRKKDPLWKRARKCAWGERL